MAGGIALFDAGARIGHAGPTCCCSTDALPASPWLCWCSGRVVACQTMPMRCSLLRPAVITDTTEGMAGKLS